MVATSVILAIAGLVIYAAIRIGGQSIARMNQAKIRAVAIKNLEQIALAMNNYAADHGRYPPPVTTDDQGRPMHSWRVLLLPYLGEDELYNQYQQLLPWNAPENASMQWQMPDVYRHPLGGGVAAWSSVSNYYVITGPGTLFPPSGPSGPKDVYDSPSQTILVVEAAPRIGTVSWTEPVDLAYVNLTGDLTEGGGDQIGGLSVGGATVATVDGRGHFLDETILPSTVRALVTPDGGEPLADDVLD